MEFLKKVWCTVEFLKSFMWWSSLKKSGVQWSSSTLWGSLLLCGCLVQWSSLVKQNPWSRSYPNFDVQWSTIGINKYFLGSLGFYIVEGSDPFSSLFLARIFFSFFFCPWERKPVKIIPLFLAKCLEMSDAIPVSIVETLAADKLLVWWAAVEEYVSSDSWE